MVEVRHTVAIPYSKGYDTDKCRHYRTVDHKNLVKVVTDKALSGKTLTVTEGSDQFGYLVLEFSVIESDDETTYETGGPNGA